jgi:hypothetical protein
MTVIPKSITSQVLNTKVSGQLIARLANCPPGECTVSISACLTKRHRGSDDLRSIGVYLKVITEEMTPEQRAACTHPHTRTEEGNVSEEVPDPVPWRFSRAVLSVELRWVLPGIIEVKKSVWNISFSLLINDSFPFLFFLAFFFFFFLFLFEFIFSSNFIFTVVNRGEYYCMSTLYTNP